MGNEVTLTPKGERWRRTGHPWVYRDDLKEPDRVLSGEVVRVVGPDGAPRGQAFYNAASKIALRWLTDDPERPVDRAFWAERLEAALDLRERVVRETDACRLIHAEADGFPGLVVDRYAGVLVLQILSLGIERIRGLILELLTERVRPAAVAARNDSPVRRLEGLPQEKGTLSGTVPERVEIREGDRRLLVNVMNGQKTGAYLDQRENRLWARQYARGRVLDAFAYQGGFSLQLAGQAEEVWALEDSADAVAILKENLSINGITTVKPERANAFDRLRELEKEKQRFDLVVLDPPAFAKNRSQVKDALRGYREINLRAMRLLEPEGTLISCSCSHGVDEPMFLETLRQASNDTRRPARLLEIRTQARDHPILLTHPESRYLKCIALEVV